MNGKALVFGAGNIGRGFLGYLLGKSQYHVTFVDVDTKTIQELNTHRSYPVITVSTLGQQEEWIRDVSGLDIKNEEALTHAVVEADIIMTAVGKLALNAVSKPLCAALWARIQRRSAEQLPIVVVACENIEENTAYLKQLLFAHLTPDQRQTMEKYISFPNCVVDRIVPNMEHATHHAPLTVCVEDYYQLAIDCQGLIEPFPSIAGIQLASNLHALLDQKLFTLNMGHAVVGYYGYIKGYEHIHSAMQDSEIRALLDGALAEVEHALTTAHPTISVQAQRSYAEQVVQRFLNPYLKDQVVRVTRQPLRKLGPQDRLISPARLLAAQGGVPAFLATGIAAALRFDYPQDIQATDLKQRLREQGIGPVLAEASQLPTGSMLSQLVSATYRFSVL